MKKIALAVVTGLLIAGGVWAGQIVDQGSPGNQGPWKVSLTAGPAGGINVNILDSGVWVNGSRNAGSGTPEEIGATWQVSNPVLVAGFQEGSAQERLHPIPTALITDEVTEITTGAPVWFVKNDGAAPYTMSQGSVDIQRNLFTSEADCFDFDQFTESVAAASTAIVGFSLTATKWVTFCNGKENPVGSAIKCDVGSGGVVALGASNPGTYLEVGDCVTFPVDALSFIPACITNGGALPISVNACNKY